MWRTICLFSNVGEGTLAPWDPTRQARRHGPLPPRPQPDDHRRVHGSERGDARAGIRRGWRSGPPPSRGQRDLHAALRGARPGKEIRRGLRELPSQRAPLDPQRGTRGRRPSPWRSRWPPWPLRWRPALAGPPGIASHGISRPEPGRGARLLDARAHARGEPLDQPDGPAASACRPLASASAQPPDQETDPARSTPPTPSACTGSSSSASARAAAAARRPSSPRATAASSSPPRHCVVQPAVEGGVSPRDLGHQRAVRARLPQRRRPARQLRRHHRARRVRVDHRGDLSVDVGAITLAPQAGVAVENALGSRGVSFNRPLDTYKKNKTRFQVFGYPAQARRPSTTASA